MVAPARRRPALVRILACALVILGISAAPARGVILPFGFEKQPVIVNVFEPGRPVAFAPLPDGRFLIVERNTARVRLHPVGGANAPIIHTVPNVGTLGERGLLGVAVDPAWPTRPYVYMYYTHATLTGRVVMFTATGDLEDPQSTSLQLTSPYEILNDIPDLHEIHNGGTLRFGTDGMLYLSLGDDGDGCNAQDLSSLGGTILRLDVSAMPGVGPGPPPKADITPPDNPFSGPGENERLVWVWGLRNPFRFTVDPATNDLVIGDVGWLTAEEVNHVPFASGGGQNFGWPHLEGHVDPGLGYHCGENNTFTGPIYENPHGPIASIVVGPRYRVQGGEHAFPTGRVGSSRPNQAGRSCRRSTDRARTGPIRCSTRSTHSRAPTARST
jgi:glucose/arabinose dehydrogenase